MFRRSDTLTDIVTKDDLIDTFKALGLGPGRIIEVHSSLSSLGYVVGGAQTVVDALMECVTEEGTIIMPVQLGDNTDPSSWNNPPVRPNLWDTIRESMPVPDPRHSDLRKMGAVVENFRQRDGVIFSPHPCEAYAAWGKFAKVLCNHQSFHFPLSEESPAARLYELKGDVLMIGTGVDTCTCLHLAEYRSDCRPIVIRGTSTGTEDGPQWRKYLDLEVNSDDFTALEQILIKRGIFRQLVLNQCKISCFPAADAIDEAMNYFDRSTVYDLYRS